MTTATQSPLWRYRLVVGAAAVLAVLALVLTIIRWAAPAVNTTITTAAPTYTEDRVAAAKKDACDAVDRTNDPLTRAAKNAWAAPPATPESALAVTEFQKVALVEVGYLESRTRPETPEPVRGAVRAYTTAIYAAVDAVTRGTPAADRVNDVKEAGAQIDKACG
ncbi:Uncharacterised protein [Mycobacteroides abscessus subsp. abscessus]|nr:Uncharacterised protein [Mycobacteroides abscessus subsp. abscessus]SIG34512.1 Uncharacterised protein [Mycobacteroides abscessus subsp. abscessus]SIG62238.1 Uncharacterised protein [Mycobacteroides abscessus subsp. abscessus]